MLLLGRAIYFAVLSALVIAALLISAFAAALLGLGHGGIVALMFVVALALLITSLIELTRETRVHDGGSRLNAAVGHFASAYRQIGVSALEWLGSGDSPRTRPPGGRR